MGDVFNKAIIYKFKGEQLTSEAHKTLITPLHSYIRLMYLIITSSMSYDTNKSIDTTNFEL